MTMCPYLTTIKILFCFLALLITLSRISGIKYIPGTQQWIKNSQIGKFYRYCDDHIRRRTSTSG
ncbi:hypothetical protein pb186bvf_020228 [Paramecium bursaria]